ncbi:MAG: helix-turn-helix transcriptional regulator [Vicinamibacterales bacterium]
MRSRQSRHDVLLSLIEQAYAAAETPPLWEPFLRSLAESVNGRGAGLLQHDLVASGAINVAVRIDPAGLALYNRHFNTLDPWAAGARALGIGVVATDEMLISPHDLRRTEYFNDFATQFDASRLLTVILDRHGGTHSGLTVVRGERDAPFESSDRDLISAVVPHVRQALRIHRRLDTAQHAHAVAIEALDLAPCAVFLVTADAGVVLANRGGLAMLTANDGLSTDRSRLSAVDSRDTTRLRELCAAVAVTRADVPRHPGGVMSLGRRASERPPLQVVVAPAPSAEPPGLQDDRVTAVVFVSDPAEERSPGEVLLREAYGLTPAESQVAARIAVGRTLAEIAAERGSAIETVRRQSKQILSKTGARHRGQLVRLLSTMPPASRTD